MGAPKLFVQPGQRFGRGTVTDPEAGYGSRGHRQASLICDCGTEYAANLSSLVSGTARSCGCLAREMAAERMRARGLSVEAGDRFGRGVVTDPEIRVREGNGARLQCDCGRVYEARVYNLISGNTQSCGCLSTKWKNRDAIKEGDRFGRGVVTDPDAGRGSAGHRLVRLRCDCGNEYASTLAHCQTGMVRSCGCLPGMRTHGMYLHPLFKTWQGMLTRCENPNHMHYANYGGRGIKVCAEWHDPAVFIAYIETVLGPKPTPAHSIDRIDNDSNYEPGNIKWSTATEQARNRRSQRHKQARQP